MAIFKNEDKNGTFQWFYLTVIAVCIEVDNNDRF